MWTCGCACAGSFDLPEGVEVAGHELFVCDTYNNRIQESSGRPTRLHMSFEPFPFLALERCKMQCVTCTAFVMKTYCGWPCPRCGVQVFDLRSVDTAPKYLRTLGAGYGSATGQFRGPWGVLERNGILVVNEGIGKRVQLLDAQSGAVRGVLKLPAKEMPCGVTIDADGCVYVVTRIGHDHFQLRGFACQQLLRGKKAQRDGAAPVDVEMV